MENFYFEQCKKFLKRVSASKNVLSGAAQHNVIHLREYARLIKDMDHRSTVVDMIITRLANIESKRPTAVIESHKGDYTSDENWCIGEKWRLLCHVYADITGLLPIRPMADIYRASQSKN